MTIPSPFPYFGGKSKVAPLVWSRFGNLYLYIEPFFGSGAVLFGRPTEPKLETVNDIDGLVVNFWRAVKNAPEEVAEYADNPVIEDDLTARHIWLVQYGIPEMNKHLPADPDYYDAKIAGWWVWGICCWIGSGWCSGNGPWREENGVIVRRTDKTEQGIGLRKPHIYRGIGINRQLVHMGQGRGIMRQLPHLGSPGQGINRPASNAWETSIQDRRENLVQYMYAIANRLRNVRICNGDWKRIVTYGAMSHGYGEQLGVFLDPPYSDKDRSDNLYRHDTMNLRDEILEWCHEHDKNIKIALCGYEGEYNVLEERGWDKIARKANRAYGNMRGETQNSENRHRERIWFSPLCVEAQMGLI